MSNLIRVELSDGTICTAVYDLESQSIILKDRWNRTAEFPNDAAQIRYQIGQGDWLTLPPANLFVLIWNHYLDAWEQFLNSREATDATR